MSKGQQPQQVTSLQLAYKKLKTLNAQQLAKYTACKSVDLTDNELQHLDFLYQFQQLDTLMADGNAITANSKLPKIESLQTLMVNRNNIANITVFMDKVVQCFPNLKYLSMLNNSACPNYFNGGSLSQYNDYRMYVISRLPNLTHLDSTEITEEEKTKALQRYGNISVPSLAVGARKKNEPTSPTTAPANEQPAEPKKRVRRKKATGEGGEPKKRKKKPAASSTTPSESTESLPAETQPVEAAPLSQPAQPEATTSLPPAPAPRANDDDDSDSSSLWSDNDEEETKVMSQLVAEAMKITPHSSSSKKSTAPQKPVPKQQQDDDDDSDWDED